MKTNKKKHTHNKSCHLINKFGLSGTTDMGSLKMEIDEFIRIGIQFVWLRARINDTAANEPSDLNRKPDLVDLQQVC